MKTKGFDNFKDAGRTERDYDSPITSSSKKSKTKTVHQRIKIDAKNFPYLHSEEIGESCTVLVQVKKVAESVPESYEPDKDNSITLEIISIAEPEHEYEDIIKKES